MRRRSPLRGPRNGRIVFFRMQAGNQRHIGWSNSPQKNPPYFILIERALRDEGTSYHYLPPAKYAHIQKDLIDVLINAHEQSSVAIERGSTWTTDAPFREVQASIDFARSQGILAVEMEAAALYAFAEARKRPVICFALVTNQMGNKEEDFEKGDDSGSTDTLKLIAVVAKRWIKLNAKSTSSETL